MIRKMGARGARVSRFSDMVGRTPGKGASLADECVWRLVSEDHPTAAERVHVFAYPAHPHAVHLEYPAIAIVIVAAVDCRRPHALLEDDRVAFRDHLGEFELRAVRKQPAEMIDEKRNDTVARFEHV